MRKQRSNARGWFTLQDTIRDIEAYLRRFWTMAALRSSLFSDALETSIKPAIQRCRQGLRSRVNTDAIWGKTLNIAEERPAGWVLGNILTMSCLLRLGNPVFSLVKHSGSGVSLRLPRWRRWKRSPPPLSKAHLEIISRRYGRSPGRSAFHFYGKAAAHAYLRKPLPLPDERGLGRGKLSEA